MWEQKRTENVGVISWGFCPNTFCNKSKNLTGHCKLLSCFTLKYNWKSVFVSFIMYWCHLEGFVPQKLRSYPWKFRQAFLKNSRQFIGWTTYHWLSSINLIRGLYTKLYSLYSRSTYALSITQQHFTKTLLSLPGWVYAIPWFDYG